eukprot:594926-Amphidinium_carterae.1
MLYCASLSIPRGFHAGVYAVVQVSIDSPRNRYRYAIIYAWIVSFRVGLGNLMGIRIYHPTAIHYRINSPNPQT